MRVSCCRVFVAFIARFSSNWFLHALVWHDSESFLRACQSLEQPQFSRVRIQRIETQQSRGRRWEGDCLDTQPRG